MDNEERTHEGIEYLVWCTLSGEWVAQSMHGAIGASAKTHDEVVVIMEHWIDILLRMGAIDPDGTLRAIPFNPLPDTHIHFSDN